MAPGLRIGYDATAAVSQRAGIGRYSRELLAALIASEDANEYAVYYAGKRASVPLPNLGDRARMAPLPVSDRLANAVWQRLRLPVPIELRTGRLDLMYCPDFSLPPSLAPGIATVHDLAFEVVPQFTYPTLAAYLRLVTPRSVARSAAVVVTSHNTKRDVIRHYGADPDKIFVIPIGVSSTFAPTPQPDDGEVLRRFKIGSPFILTVGTLEPRKNLARLLEAYAALPADVAGTCMVVVGRRGWMYGEIFETWRRLKLNGRVMFLEQVEDADLAAMYRRAEITVYASIYEGFGLPPLEAMASGSPVACSGNSAIGEVVQSAAEIFDPWDVSDMRETIAALLQTASRREELRRAGPARAGEFTWERVARQMLELYRRVAHS
ncbi:MAG TPA: glycosyltransferase family 1 protein [Chloroflexota bacterium]|nr:glycosyltransferase family 1 protein [Chloroflexota bacterium]